MVSEKKEIGDVEKLLNLTYLLEERAEKKKTYAKRIYGELKNGRRILALNLRYYKEKSGTETIDGKFRPSSLKGLEDSGSIVRGIEDLIGGGEIMADYESLEPQFMIEIFDKKTDTKLTVPLPINFKENEADKAIKELRLEAEKLTKSGYKVETYFNGVPI